QENDDLAAPRELALDDIERQRFLSRVGTGAATLAGFFFLGPLGAALSIGGGVMNEQVLTERLGEQRKLIHRELDNYVDRSLDLYTSQVAARLSQFYNQLMQDIRNEQRAWHAAHAPPTSAEQGTQDATLWSERVEATKALRAEILALLD